MKKKRENTHKNAEGEQNAKLGIGIEETNASIGITACIILVRYRTKKMLECISFVRYWICPGIDFFIPVPD
jgi:hypothetical protein